VPAGDRPPGLGDDRGSGVEDRGHREAREVLREGGDVDGQHDPAAHGEHVAAGVGGGDRPVVGGSSTSGGKKSVVDTSAVVASMR
jgi:hypothetical protein